MANSKAITKNDLLKIFEKIQSKFPLKQDTGWHNAELSSSFALYGSTSAVKYRRVGNTVTIEGEVKPTANITGTDSPYRIFTLPEGYRPDFRQDIICQGSGNSTWLLTVTPEGDVNFARYRDYSLTTGTSFQTITPSHWLPFTITYLVDECSNQSDAFFIANGKVQEKLVSGVNIKSINGESLLGNGNMIISGGGGGGSTDQLLDIFYPVGSYYETSKSTSEFNPNVAWGGTWELETAGQVHVSSGTEYSISGALTNNSDGGNKDAIIPYHNHGTSVTQPTFTTPNHTHTITYTGDASSALSGTSPADKGAVVRRTTSSSVNANWSTNSTGGGVGCNRTTNVGVTVGYSGESVTNKNMPPYIVVNRWHRVA